MPLSLVPNLANCMWFTRISSKFDHQVMSGTLSKKNYGIIWEFFPNVGPPPAPPFGNPLFERKKCYRLFCILGVKDHFCSSQKNHFLSGIFTTKFGNKGPPPPFRKNSQIIPYFFMREDNSDNGSLPLNDY